MISIPANDSPILVVDDDTGLLLLIKTTLISAGMPEPALVSDSTEVMSLIRKHKFQLVLLDLNMPQIDGMELLRRIKAEFPLIECVIITAVDDVETAIQAMKIGAYDYIVKPIKGERLVIIINRAMEKYNLRQELTLYTNRPSFSDLDHPDAFGNMVAEDEAMAMVFRQVEVVAPTDYSVVIMGESGTGKEMLANILHRLSARKQAPFIGVNMAAFSKTLFEDEFFGHAKGAYTDAVSEKMGFFEKAHGGTLFLDEISELEFSLQGKLLRVIEEKEFYRLGTTEARDIDVRIIAATNRNINEEIKGGNFRSDLYYRLNMYNIQIPPLRERPKDILPLARHFLKVHATANRKPINAISSEAADYLVRYPFPGNVRELNNMIASSILQESGKTITLASLNISSSVTENETPENQPLTTLAELEKRHIQRVLKATGGNRVKAAGILGVNASTVYRKIEKYGIAE